jgi:hypothetical protein
MKESIRHGGVVRCDMVKVVETKKTIAFKGECEERFISYSVSSLVRAQAANADWARVKVKLVKWPGNPPAGDNKKVDLCPKHSALVMTTDELKAHKLKRKEQRKAEKLVAKKNKPKKPRKPRQKKNAPASP